MASVSPTDPPACPISIKLQRKKSMKKVISLLLALLIALFLVACGDDNGGKNDTEFPGQGGLPGSDGIETPIIDLE